MDIARIVVGIVLMVAAAVVAVQLWNGRCLSLIAPPSKTKKGVFYPEGTMKAGQRASWVMVACAVSVAALVAYQMGKLAGNPTFVEAATLISNVTLVAFCVSLVWCLFSGPKDKSFRERFRSGNGRLLLFLLASCIALTLTSLLFA